MSDYVTNLIGKRIKDNDPRMPNRVRVIVSVFGQRVTARIREGDKWGETRIALARIYSDGKARRTGWSVLP